MEIVIKIDDNTYKDIVDNRIVFDEDNTEVATAIINGTPLPKGHGRIIDESKIEVCEWVDVWEEDYPKASTDAPTIIEADGGEEDEDRKSL